MAGTTRRETDEQSARMQHLAWYQMQRREGSTAHDLSDVPVVQGMSSPRLQQILWEEKLYDLEILFRYRGITRREDLIRLDTAEQAVIVRKAAEFFDVLNVKVDHRVLEDKLDYLFTNNTCGRQPNTNIRLSYLQAPDHATAVKKALEPALYNAIPIYGEQRYWACKERLQRGTELIKAACLEAAKGLADLVAMEGVSEKDPWVYETLKAAKKSMRDVILWFCVGVVGGLDSKEALNILFQDICKQAGCDGHARDDLLNAFQHTTGPKGLDMTNKRQQFIRMLEAQAKADAARGSKDKPSDDEAERDQRVELQLDQISTKMQMEQISEMLNTLMLDMKEVKDKLP